MATNNHKYQKWMREIDRYLPVKKLFLLYGNVYDMIPYPQVEREDEYTYESIRSAIRNFLSDKGYKNISFYDITGCMEKYEKKDGEEFKPLPESKCGMKTDAALSEAEAMLKSKEPSAFVIDFSSRLCAIPEQLDIEQSKVFLKILKTVQTAKKVAIKDIALNNILILICDKINDIPVWLYLNNPDAKSIVIEKPDSLDRRKFLKNNLFGFYGYTEDMSEDIKDKSIDKMTDLTDGLCMSEILSLALISKREKISIADEKGVKNVIDKYKFGDVESHWQKDILKEKLNENENIFVRRVKGQMPAIRAVLDIIKRASMGLSGVQHSSGSSKPRGILFFAGPTGVGKTELAKTLAAVLFGDAERSFHRFDMSEYSLEHADQKLMGAPPGYLGYDAGGQLTNFIKERPFSVLLFDEIEKAHPSVLDKFLQILEDGRMTDGKGETVYFSESILVFTSNLGAYVDVTLENGRVMRQVNIYPMCWACTKCNDQKAIDVSGVKPGKCAKCGCTDLEHKETPYSVIKSRIKEAINDHFKFRLGRPELLNRFGNNFVIFDYIRKPVMEEIIEDILEHNIKDEIRVKHGVNLIFSDKVKKWLLDRACQNIEHGGRGVGNLIETSIVNPLARKMFDMESIQKIKEIHISAVIENIESEEFDIHMEIK